jgi:sugar lactone lactonase YvrE
MTARQALDVVQVPAYGTEDVVVATSGPDEGAVFTGTADGSIWRVRHDGRRIDRVAGTGGRPMGIELDGDGRLLVCDAKVGVLRVDVGTGAVETLVDRVAGAPMVFCNNAAIGTDGAIWFSDSSAHFGIDDWQDEIAMNTHTGRLMRLGTDGTVEVVLTGLAFANGVAVAADGSSVTVAETGARTVVRRWLTGARAGERDLLVDDLPGYPDNLSRGSDGLLWVALASPKDPVVERVQHGPGWLRRTARALPASIQPKAKRTVRAQAYDDTGRLVHDVDVSAERFHMVTGVREHDGRLWLGSLQEPAVAVVTL